MRQQERALQALVQKRNFSAAFELARGMVERFPKRGLAWKIVGAFPPNNDNYDEAIVALQTAVRLLPRDAEAHVNLGLTLAKAKRFPEAEFHLHKALELKPGFAAAHYRLAMAYERRAGSPNPKRVCGAALRCAMGTSRATMRSAILICCFS